VLLVIQMHASAVILYGKPGAIAGVDPGRPCGVGLGMATQALGALEALLHSPRDLFPRRGLNTLHTITIRVG